MSSHIVVMTIKVNLYRISGDIYPLICLFLYYCLSFYGLFKTFFKGQGNGYESELTRLLVV